MNFSNFAQFELSQEQQDEKNVEIRNNSNILKNNIKQHVKKHNLRELKSMYFDMSSYYYNDGTKALYKVSNIPDHTKNVTPNFELICDYKILEYNNIYSSFMPNI